MKKRKDHEQPLAIEKWGWRYHHIGIPTKEKIQDERYIPHLKFSVGGFDTSPFGIEWMRFDDDSPFDELIKTVPHIAFEIIWKRLYRVLISEFLIKPMLPQKTFVWQ
ncbi:MAG: hypothetical protein PWP52_1193 [Bacteroidales bacterium]|nr:hypothetical protein [Bacteroidales bacterium]